MPETDGHLGVAAMWVLLPCWPGPVALSWCVVADTNGQGWVTMFGKNVGKFLSGLQKHYPCAPNPPSSSSHASMSSGNIVLTWEHEWFCHICCRQSYECLHRGRAACMVSIPLLSVAHPTCSTRGAVVLWSWCNEKWENESNEIRKVSVLSTPSTSTRVPMDEWYRWYKAP